MIRFYFFSSEHFLKHSDDNLFSMVLRKIRPNKSCLHFTYPPSYQASELLSFTINTRFLSSSMTWYHTTLFLTLTDQDLTRSRLLHQEASRAWKSQGVLDAGWILPPPSEQKELVSTLFFTKSLTVTHITREQIGSICKTKRFLAETSFLAL